MSMYNALFGMNPDTDKLLSLVGLKRIDVERFRDCSVEEDGTLCILARTGGGNREAFPQHALTSNPYYIRDEDDDFDSTYAYYYFSIPSEGEASHVS